MHPALEEPPISLEEAARRYSPIYAPLRDVIAQSGPVETARPKSLERIGAYSRAESFAHVVVRHRGHVASILLTPVDQAPATHAQAAPCPSSEGFLVACFDARGHAGFVVSDLTDAENLELARDLAPVLQTDLRG